MGFRRVRVTALRSLWAFMAIWSVVAALAATASAEPHLFFSRDFPKSVPPYFEVELTPAGHVIYREAPNEEDPLTFTLRPGENDVIFELVKKLDGLRRPIASDRKVAFTGDKIIRYFSGNGDPAEVRYTYTDDDDARVLERWFLRMSESAGHLFELERVVRFDRLGVNKTLLSFQTSFDKERVVAAHQFLPILKKIANGKRFIHMAQARAAALVTRIEAQGEQGRSMTYP